MNAARGTRIWLAIVVSLGVLGVAASSAAAASRTISIAEPGPAAWTATSPVGFHLAQQWPLTVTKNGSGVGTVTSAPSGILCGPKCANDFDEGTVVTLTAEGAGFFGWSGGGCSGTGTCQVTMDAAKSVNATFNSQRLLEVFIRSSDHGSGRIVSTPAGIDCTSSFCEARFDLGSSVTLTAIPDPGSRFGGWNWSGVCQGTGPCTVTMDRDRAVTVSFDEVATLSVVKAGTGDGVVGSVPGGISCGATCSAQFLKSDTVVLFATASPGSVFTGWSCPGQASCTNIPMRGGDVTVTATFTAMRTLTVAKDGTGSGLVRSAPGGIDCGGSCAADFVLGTPVTLTATPASGSLFLGWTGAGCSGTGTCQVTMSEARSVTASFRAAATLTILKGGFGTGVVTSTPAGIDCGATCVLTYDTGAVITLTATADPGSSNPVLVGGGCQTGGPTCVLTMSESRQVTAFFWAPPKPYNVTVTKTGTGTGTVTDSFYGVLNCGAVCTSVFFQGDVAVLKAFPDAGSRFTGWSELGCGAQGCAVYIDADTTVTADFTLTGEPTPTPTATATADPTATAEPTATATAPPDATATPSPTVTATTIPTVTPSTVDTRLTKVKIKRKKRKATFTFVSIGKASGFECALTKKAKKAKKAKFKPCTSPKAYKKLKRGRYTFQVRAVGDTSPARKKFKI